MGQLTSAVIASVLLVTAAPVSAQQANATFTIVLPEGRLAEALRTLAVRTRTGIVFSPEVVGNARSPRVSGRMSIEQLLSRLIEGSGLAFRRTSSNVFVVYRPSLENPEAAVPEILVIGRMTQNVDIRRSENDIRPYHVSQSKEVRSSHSETPDSFLRERLPSDAQSEPPSLSLGANVATNRSEVNLHGIGANHTLMLVDGARMAGIPTINGLLSNLQPDINAIPVMAIDRIETLTGTAGGIYGPGATGGVVNVIMKRTYRGAEMHGTLGLSDRGDGAYRRLDFQLGFTPNSGRTEFSLFGSTAMSDGLKFGDRSYPVLSRELIRATDPAYLASNDGGIGAVLIKSPTDEKLTFKPAFGGGSLGASFTYLPLDFAGPTSAAISALRANAGSVSSALSADSAGSGRSLTNATRINSVLGVARHHVTDNIEIFADLLWGDNRSTAVARSSAGRAIYLASEPDNPFEQAIVVSAPVNGIGTYQENRIRSYRMSGGLILRLPQGWSGEAGYYRASAAQDIFEDSTSLLSLPFDFPLSSAGPLNNPRTFATAGAAGLFDIALEYRSRSGLDTAHLRLAGPIATLPGGPMSLSVLAERRGEQLKTSTTDVSYLGFATNITRRGYDQTTHSAYAELQAPIFGDKASFPLLRGLKVQLAARYDDIETRLPDLLETELLTVRDAALAYSAGLRALPADKLLLRASIATGVLPPTPTQLQPRTLERVAQDPKRSGETITIPVNDLGSIGLPPERARTISVGLVINPDGNGRPRLSIDYQHIDIRRQINDTGQATLPYFLANEDRYPGRIVRSALTPADIAAGHSAGRILSVDASYPNDGRTLVDAVDIRGDYELRSGANSIRLYGVATWTPSLRRRAFKELPANNYVGFANGPLRWRGNGGVDWDSENLTLGLNGQFYGSYLATETLPRGVPRGTGTTTVNMVPAQFYLDLNGVVRLDAPASSLFKKLSISFAVKNLFGQTPPTVANTDFGYSYYADARGRRFELLLTTSF